MKTKNKTERANGGTPLAEPTGSSVFQLLCILHDLTILVERDKRLPLKVAEMVREADARVVHAIDMMKTNTGREAR